MLGILTDKIINGGSNLIATYVSQSEFSCSSSHFFVTDTIILPFITAVFNAQATPPHVFQKLREDSTSQERKRFLDEITIYK